MKKLLLIIVAAMSAFSASAKTWHRDCTSPDGEVFNISYNTVEAVISSKTLKPIHLYRDHSFDADKAINDYGEEYIAIGWSKNGLAVASQLFDKSEVIHIFTSDKKQGVKEAFKCSY